MSFNLDVSLIKCVFITTYHIIITVYRSSSAEAVYDIDDNIDNLRIMYVLRCIHDMQTDLMRKFS